MRTPARLCYLCEKKPAKKLDSDYVAAYEGKAFCSMKCATAWALIEIKHKLTNAELHECEVTGQFEYDEDIVCEQKCTEVEDDS